MKNTIIFTIILLVCPLFVVSAQQINETDSIPVFRTKGSTMATSSVSGETLLNRSSIDIGNSLYGRLNGLTVLQNTDYYISGETSPTMLIRGLGTINNNGVLVLIDGVQRTIDLPVPEEIEDVTILKDAAALALYGVRGANGVMLITTKRGLQGKIRINVGYRRSMTTPTRIPEFADAATYAQAVNEGLANEGLAPRYTSSEIAAYRDQTYPYLYPNVDWVDETLRQWGQRDQVNFSASGGSDRARFFSLIDYGSDRGFIKNPHENPAYSTQMSGVKLNIRNNLDLNISRTTLMQLNLLGRIGERIEPGSLSGYDLMSTLYNLPANAYPVRNESGSWGGANNTPLNPIARSTSTGYTQLHHRGIFADLTLKQDLGMLVEGLNIEGKVSFDAYSESYDIRSKQFLYEQVTAPLDASGRPGQTTVTQYGQDDQGLGFSSSAYNMSLYYKMQFRLNYNRQIGAGYLTSFLSAGQDKQTLPGQFNTNLHQDVTAFGHYALKDRYFFDLSLSASGSSRLPKNNQWGFLPAVGAAWRISEENFLQDSRWLDELKLRASFGLAGNDRITYNLDAYPFVWAGDYIFRDYTSFGGMREGHLPSQRATYEKTRMLNIGLEAQMFCKLTINADVFFNKTYDIMVSREGVVSSMLGATAAYEPNGEVQNHGFEIGMNYGSRTGDFKYNIGGQFSFVRNKIINMNEAYKPHDYMKYTGHPIGQQTGWEIIGFFEDQADIDQSPQQLFSTVYPGDYKYRDQNGDNRIDEYDAVRIGHTTAAPEIYYSANIDLEYKGIGLSALFQGVGNYSKILGASSIYVPLINNTNISEHYLESYWKPGADNSNVKYPRLTTTSSLNNYRNNSTYIVDGSYLKLRVAELYWDLPTSWVSRIRLSGFRVFVRGTDLFTISKIKVTDPESTGLQYPALRAYHAGFSLTF